VSEPRDEIDSKLSHIYREGGWPEPRRQIDQAILAASRRAARRERSFVRRWSPPFALAATVVLSFTLFLRVSEEKPGEYAPPVPEQRPAPPAEEAKSAEKPKPDATAKPAAAPRPQVPPPPARPAESLATRKPAPKPAAARAPVPPQPFTPAPRLAPVERAAPAPRAAPVPQPAPAAAALKKEAPETVRADRPETAPEPRSEDRRALESAPVREALPGAPAPLPSAPPRAIEPFAQPSAPDATGAASGAPAASDAAAGIVIRRSTPERSPQSWLEDIRRLKTEGKTGEAARELAEFRKRYPEYALPEDLR
jgi:hypothetical protein